MRKDYFKNNWRKLDNVAKVFSMDYNNDTNVFRYSVILKQKVNKDVLKKAVMKTLDFYKSFKVKLGTGLFWNYIEYNSKEPIVVEENDIPCQNIEPRENNNYLFKVTYFKNKINLDVFHVLTDGLGASKFLKSILYNYLNLKHGIDKKMDVELIEYQDQFLKNYDKKMKCKKDFKFAYQIPGKIIKNVNNTYHYIVDVLKIKDVSKKYKATITEYITSLYIYSMYLSMYKKGSKKDIVITMPVDVRKYYKVDTLSNFFVCAKINANVNEKKKVSFKMILKQVQKEFKTNITEERVKGYLKRDVDLGTNIIIRLVPLPLKKVIMRVVFDVSYNSSTSMLSNVGIIDIDSEYRKYINNILVMAKPSKYEKMKCCICSYDSKLNITINSNIDDKKFQHVFLKQLSKEIKNVKLESNTNLI